MSVTDNSAKFVDPGREAIRRLRIVLLLFSVALILPLAYLILNVRAQLRTEVFFHYRNSAEEIVSQVNKNVGQLFNEENQRPFADYGFISVAENRLLNQRGISFSPLSELPPRSSVPGIIGYFQMEPDGAVSSPVLPRIEGDHSGDLAGISSSELQKRKELFEKIKAIVKEGKTDSGMDFSSLDLPSWDAKEERNGYMAKTFTREGLERVVGLFLSPAVAQPEKSKLGTALPKADSQRALSSSKLDAANVDSSLYLKKGEEVQKSRQKDVSAKFTAQTSRVEEVVVPQYENTFGGLRSLFDSRRESSKKEANTKVGAALFESLDESPPREMGSSKEISEKQHPAMKKTQSFSFMSFEGEIDPLQFKMLKDDVFVFYRKVWRNKQLYIQGFLIEGEKFLQEVVWQIESLDHAQIFSSLIVSLGGEIFRRYPVDAIGGETSRKEILLYRGFMRDPVGAFELIISTNNLPIGPGEKLANSLTLLIALILVIGLSSVYFLGLKQIQLAKDRSNFVSAVSHELKTPLTSIRMYAEMLRAGWVKDEEKQKRYYDFIFSESERLSRLIANVLQLSRLSNNRVSLELKEYTPVELVTFIQSKTASQVESAGFKLTVEYPKEAEPNLCLLVDEDSVACIFINLVDNAVKFSNKAERREIVLSCRRSEIEKNRLIVSVRDFGPGVERSQREKIFKLFYRGTDELTRTSPGTGIGLALVRELAARIDAKVDFKNREPGAEFEVRFCTAS